MSIALLKEIEDLKSQCASVNEQLSIKIDAKVSTMINTVITEFKDFFQVQGFKVEESSSPKIIAASYGSIGVAMKYHDVEEKFMGAITTFELATKLPNQVQYIVAVRRGSRLGGVSVTMSSSRDNENPDDVQRREIEKLKKDLINAQTRLSNFESEVWTLYLYEKDKRMEEKAFPSMTSILETLIQ